MITGYTCISHGSETRGAHELQLLNFESKMVKLSFLFEVKKRKYLEQICYFEDCTTPLSKPFLSKFFFFRIVCRIYVWTKFLCLRKVCLRNLCLRKVTLRKVCLRNMCLRKKSFSNVCLSKVCLRKVCLRNVCLRKVCLRQVCLESYTNFS